MGFGVLVVVSGSRRGLRFASLDSRPQARLKAAPKPVDVSRMVGLSPARREPADTATAVDLGIDGAPELVFQPAVDLATGRLLGFEALLRWRVPGPVPRVIAPLELIAVAEKCGRMTQLNAWVLREACMQAVGWKSHLQVAVNCSIFQLRRKEAASAAAEALRVSGLLPDRLTVEVTEAAVADARAKEELRAMTRLGIQLTLDDIESDTSIPENFDRLAVGTMKIDGKLVAGLERPGDPSRAIAGAIIELSRSLHICTVAECVETAAQAAILRGLGADVGQGHFFSPPVSADEARALSMEDPAPTYLIGAPETTITREWPLWAD